MTIRTNTRFQGDLMDVLRLFYPSGDGPDLRHEHRETGGQFVEWVSALGGEPRAFSSPAASGTPLELDRAVKRAAKIAVYELLKARTGAHPPWGSLTGIRPTRLFYEAVEQGLSPEDAERQMIRRYDVDPVRASLLRDIHRMQRGLIERAPDEFDLYIGIPFCTTRCAYCSFSAGEIGNGKLVEPYLDALLVEMEASAALARAKGMRPRAAYMGGGTPTALSADQLNRVLGAAQRLFPGAAEWTVEAGRPDTIDQDKLAALKAGGVRRISINPQTFSDDTLARIGRAHTAEDTRAAYQLARDMGGFSVNMDLIAALPGEDTALFERTLLETVRLGPESVTVHTLALKHGSKLNEQGYAQADAQGAQAMVDLARDTLLGAGYRPYYLYRQKYMAGNLENVGYARSGHACVYNIDIMEETCPVLALGAGAISKWLFPGERRIERAPNLKNIELYAQRVDEMVRRKQKLILEGETP